MIKAVGWYAWNEFMPRLGSILHWSSALWVAAAVGVLLGYWGGFLIPATTKVGGIAMALLTYAAIALGFTLAGLTLVLTLPNDDFVNLLWETTPNKKKNNSYSDLIFIFSWTALIHWLIVFISILLVLLVNPEQAAFQEKKHRLLSGIITGLGMYALFQFLVTLITLAQVGSTYIAHLRKQAANKSITMH